MRVATNFIRKNVVTHNEILPRQNIRECPWDIEGLSHLTRLTKHVLVCTLFIDLSRRISEALISLLSLLFVVQFYFD